MSDKFLLKEYYEVSSDEKVLTELRSAHAEGKPMIVVGTIQRADAQNQNGRVYPYKILKKECDRYKQDLVDRKMAIGELDHTEEPIIQLKNASHIIEDLFWGGPENKDVMAKIRLLNTPMGKVAQEIVASGIPLGISSRAVGSVSKNESSGADVVGEDLQIICWDLVGTPSTHNAFLKLHESKRVFDFNIEKALPKEFRLKQAFKELLKK